MPGLLQQLLGDNSGERMLENALRMSQGKQAAAERQEARQQSAEIKAAKEAQAKVDKVRQGNLALLANPTALDKLTAQNYLPISPSIMKPEKASQYFNQTDMLDASMPEGHPQKGRASAIKELLKERLSSEEGAARPAVDILRELMAGEAQATREEAFKFKREADAGSSFLGKVVPGYYTEDESVRKLAGYDQWLEQQKSVENTRFWKELPGDAGHSLVTSAVIGGTAGAITGALGGGLPAAGVMAAAGAALGTTIVPVAGTIVGGAIGAAMGLLAGPATGALAGAAAGAGSFLLFEAGAIPAAKIIEKSEWFNANMGGTGIDRAQAMVAQTGVSLAGGLAAGKIAKFAKELGKTPVEAQKLLGYDQPTAKATKAHGTIHAASGNVIYQGTDGMHTLQIPFRGEGQKQIGEIFGSYKTLSKELITTTNKDAPILKTLGAGEMAARLNPAIRESYSPALIAEDFSVVQGKAVAINKPEFIVDVRVPKRVQPIAITENVGKNFSAEERVSAALQPPRRAIPEKVAKKLITYLPPEEQKAVLDASLHPKIGSVENALVDHIDTKRVFKNNLEKEFEYQPTGAARMEGTISSMRTLSPIGWKIPEGAKIANRAADDPGKLFMGNTMQFFSPEAPQIPYKASDLIFTPVKEGIKVSRENAFGGGTEELGTMTAEFASDIRIMHENIATVLEKNAKEATYGIYGIEGDLAAAIKKASFLDIKASATGASRATKANTKVFKTEQGKEIEYQVSAYDGTIEPKAANEIYKTLLPKEQAVVRKMAQESGVGDIASGVKEVLKQREAKTVGSFAWKERVKADIEAGKKIPRVHKLRATMEDLDIMKVTEMQAAGKLTVRQADLLASSDGLGKIKNAEAERILKKFGFDPTKIMTISALGVGSVLLGPELFGDNAEAGILSNLSTTIPKMFAGAAKAATSDTAKVAYTNDMKKINQIVVENSNPRLMPTQMMQQFDVAKYATEAYGSVLKSIEDISGKTRSIGGKIMSPGFYGDLLTKAKGHVAVQLASLEASVAGNSGAAMKVWNNIAERVPGIKGNSSIVIKEMEELSVRYADDVAPYAEVLKQIQVKEMGNKALKDILGAKGQKIARDAIRAEMEKGDAEYARLLGIKEKLTPNFKKWNAEVDAKHRDLAGRFSGSRIALAAEVDSKFTGREWLAGMLSKEEIEAVNYIKAMKSHYGQRIKADGHQIIDSKPYVHHPLHPAFAEKKVVAQKLMDAGLMPGEGTPLTKFFTRAKVSKQLVPDIDYIMQKYIPDAEKRIAYSRFWNGTKDASGNVVDEGWKSYSSQVRHLPGHKEFWQGIEKAMTPAEAIPLYQWANRYYQYEVINMIGGSVSAALKHLFKLEGTVANFGLKETLKHFPEANRQAARLAREYLAGTKWGARAGFTVKENKTATDELVDSFLSISRYRQTFAEMELDAGISQVNKSARYAKLDKVLKTAADMGSFPIKYVEWIDRAHSVLAIRDLAMSQSKLAAKAGQRGPKKGLTAFDASYQTWDTMIKMNFMGGSLNPAWQRNPAVRTLFMFQNTPAKLLERRLVNALRSKDAIVKTKDMVFKGYEQQYQALNELQGAMRYIKAAENTFKAGVYQDAVKVMDSVQTATGQAYYKQFVMDTIISGGIIYGGGQLFDADLKSHVFHFPFLKAHNQEPTLSLAPIVTGAYKTLEGQGEDPDDMFITRFIHNWQGKKGFAPQTFNKLYRISEDDIPEVYKGSWLKHLFSIPARKEH